jgi:peptide/nickel transport system substrate-binding protein
LKPYLLYAPEMIALKKTMKKTLVIAIGIILLSVGLSGCINQAEEDHEKLTELLTIGVAEGPHGFFPWIDSYDTDTLSLNLNIFNSLVEFDSSFRLLPKLAKSWINPNNCTWRFFLRDDVRFHNGYDFSAYDVKYTIDLIRNNNSHVLRDLLTEVKEVKVINAYTVDIITYQPFPILLNKLTNIPIASEQYVEETTEKWPIGTGAYKLLEYIPMDHITLVRNTDYSMGKPVIKTVIFKIIERSEDRKNALLAGQIDIFEHIPLMYINETSNIPGITLRKISNPTVWYLGFDFRENNSSGFPGMKNPFADVRVRKAIYQAIDVNRIISLLGSDAEPASQFLSPLIFGYAPDITRLPYDLNNSRRLLQEAGYEHGFHLTLDCPQEFVLMVNLTEEIARQLSAILNVSVNILPTAEQYYSKLESGNCSLYFMGWIPATGDGGEIFDYLLRSENHSLGIGSYNFGHYSNRTIDEITTQQSSIMDQKIRGRLMREGFKIAMDDVACVPLYINVCTIAYPDYLVWDPRSDLCTLVEEITVK